MLRCFFSSLPGVAAIGSHEIAFDRATTKSVTPIRRVWRAFGDGQDCQFQPPMSWAGKAHGRDAVVTKGAR
jgi:hypothetical protein